jgi:hypothetical protein
MMLHCKKDLEIFVQYLLILLLCILKKRKLLMQTNAYNEW